ncbi:hypothetical protein IW139_001823 [Coemansia sp. RSA 353]|nr:hypothetical protein IW144_002688 [Coemansia sp. RSA 522]KAJ2299260.1 hypothetical protein IW139_001823 [Coemansia sp. RSA 353]
MTTKIVNIVVAGGNYAGLNAMRHLYATLLASPDQANKTVVNITLVDRRDGFVHYIGMTRGITEPSFGSSLWVPYSTVDWLQHSQITIKQGTVADIQPTLVQLTNGEQLQFDYLVVALGISRFAPIGIRSSTKSEFVAELAESYAQLESAKSVVVVGGGAVGIELAADIKCDFPHKSVTLVHSRALPLPGPFKDELRHNVVDILQNSIGVELVLGQRVIAQEPASADMADTLTDMPEHVLSTATDATLTLSGGQTLHGDWVVRCLGTRDKKSIINLPSSTQEPIFGANGIRVKDTMQIDDVAYPHIYACGDICSRDTVKLAGVAMYGAYIAAINIARTISSVSNDSPTLEESPLYPSKILLLMSKDHFIMQLGDEIWEKEKTRQYVSEDMGLQLSIDGLSLNKVPAAYSPFDLAPAF